jgi:hypothetical protein
MIIFGKAHTVPWCRSLSLALYGVEQWLGNMCIGMHHCAAATSYSRVSARISGSPADHGLVLRYQGRRVSVQRKTILIGASRPSCKAPATTAKIRHLHILSTGVDMADVEAAGQRNIARTTSLVVRTSYV